MLNLIQVASLIEMASTTGFTVTVQVQKYNHSFQCVFIHVSHSSTLEPAILFYCILSLVR